MPLFPALDANLLYRIVNGGGRIEREYGLGRGRTDLFIHWPHPAGIQRVVIELKVIHKSRAATIKAGLAQTVEYGERCNADELHLVVFDDGKRPWSKKFFKKYENFNDVRVGVWGV